MSLLKQNRFKKQHRQCHEEDLFSIRLCSKLNKGLENRSFLFFYLCLVTYHILYKFRCTYWRDISQYMDYIARNFIFYVFHASKFGIRIVMTNELYHWMQWTNLEMVFLMTLTLWAYLRSHSISTYYATNQICTKIQ